VSDSLKLRLFDELESLVLIDPHSHINPLEPASKTLADIMGYHYYTELAHSAGYPREKIEDPGISPKEKVARLVPEMVHIRNTYQYHWLMTILKEFFGHTDDDLTTDNWEKTYDEATNRMSASNWEESVLKQSKLEGVFLTNDFDDPLKGFDTKRYIPCLRTDDLVFHLTKKSTRDRLAKATKTTVKDAASLQRAIGDLFDHFLAHNAKACAISLIPDFAPKKISPSEIELTVQKVFSNDSDVELEAGVKTQLANFVFWTLAEHCNLHKLPFDLMIGVNRGVYEAGVHQGRDLYNRQTSLIQYKELFNAFPKVTFPISVLDHTANPELVSYAWIFPNVVINGHWWYSNLPGYIEADCRSRLQGVPWTKNIGYYSDMYKLEFALPKFRMYRKVLAKVLAEDFVIDRGWSETKALHLGKEILRGNVERIFGV
jgi:Glucuronate isomerase